MAYKVSERLKKASKALCATLITSSGGYAAVANASGVTRQFVYDYSKRGYMPYGQVHNIAAALNLSPWMLSYYKLMEVFGEDSPSFAEVVQSTYLLPQEKEAIMKIANGKQGTSS